MWVRGAATVKECCGCVCELHNKKQCCEHADKRRGTLAGFYPTYVDGRGDVMKATRHDFYCPTCKERFRKKQDLKKKEGEILDGIKNRFLKKEIFAEGRLPPSHAASQKQREKVLTRKQYRHQSRPEKPQPAGTNMYLYRYGPSGSHYQRWRPTQWEQLKKKTKRNLKPALNTIDELEFDHSSDLKQTIADEELVPRCDVTDRSSFCESEIFREEGMNEENQACGNFSSEEWPELVPSPVPHAFDEDSIMSFDYIEGADDESATESWDVVSDAGSVMSFSTFNSIIEKVEPQPLSYRDAVLKNESTIQAFLQLSPSRKTLHPANKPRRILAHEESTETSEIAACEDDLDFYSIYEGYKNARGGKAKLVFKGNPKSCRHRCWCKICRPHYWEARLASKQKADLLSECRKASNSSWD